MFRRSLLVVALMPIVIAIASGFACAYEATVHGRISVAAVQASQLDSILQDRLGFANGVWTLLAKDSSAGQVSQWIAFGAVAEDYGINGEGDWETTRAYNHFHDPLKNWDGAGFDNSLLNTVYWLIYGEWPVSAILWGLDPDRQDKPRFLETTGNWSWTKARDYYYKAFTVPTRSVRHGYFADCLRALGHVMHLLQDMSVPLHTRNDLHVFPIDLGQPPQPYGRWTYETYTKMNMKYLNYSSRRPNRIVLYSSLPDPIYHYLVGVSGLFDRNQYEQGDPIPMNSELIGLAEYSNANFLTQDTMWTYQHPKLADTNFDSIDWSNPEEVDAEDGKIDHRIYLEKIEGDRHDRVEHLAAVDYYLLDYIDSIAEVDSPFLLDEKCWKDYADHLIPKAVGYSAELLDYFFRGRLEVVLSNGEMQIKNVSQEVMHSGSFELYYDDEQDVRKRIDLSNASVDSLDPGYRQTITFSSPADMGSEGILVLVYRGNLGAEAGAVIVEVIDAFGPPHEIWEDFNGDWDALANNWNRKYNVEIQGGQVRGSVEGPTINPVYHADNAYLACDDMSPNPAEGMIMTVKITANSSLGVRPVVDGEPISDEWYNQYRGIVALTVGNDNEGVVFFISRADNYFPAPSPWFHDFYNTIIIEDWPGGTVNLADYGFTSPPTGILISTHAIGLGSTASFSIDSIDFQ